MRCLIAYPTAEGQTRQFCCFAAEHLVSCGHSGDFLTVADIEALADHRFDADPCRVCSRGRGGARSDRLCACPRCRAVADKSAAPSGVVVGGGA